jgi:molybdopterin synthase sulfur carrier subunit
MEVRFYAMLREAVGGKMAVFDLPAGATAKTLLDAASQRFPPLATLIWDSNGDLGAYVKVFVDGREIRNLDGIHTPVPPDADVAIFPPSAGG